MFRLQSSAIKPPSFHSPFLCSYFSFSIEIKKSCETLRVASPACHFYRVPQSVVTAAFFVFTALSFVPHFKSCKPKRCRVRLACGSLRAAACHHFCRAPPYKPEIPNGQKCRQALCAKSTYAASHLRELRFPLAPPSLHSQKARASPVFSPQPFVPHSLQSVHFRFSRRRFFPETNKSKASISFSKQKNKGI